MVCSTGMFLILTSRMLLISIVNPSKSIDRIITEPKFTWVLSIICLYLAASDSFISRIIIPDSGIADIKGGLYYNLLNIIIFFSAINLVYDIFSSYKKEKGHKRITAKFLLFSWGIQLIVTTILGALIPLIFNNNQSALFLPLGYFLQVIIMAYGLSIYRIMNIGDIFRKFISYFLMITYSVSIYMISSKALTLVCTYFQLPAPLAQTLTFTIIIISFAPANSIFQSFANKLFINIAPIDEQKAYEEFKKNLSQNYSNATIVENFSKFASRHAGTDSSNILLNLHNMLFTDLSTNWSNKEKQDLLKLSKNRDLTSTININGGSSCKS